MILDDLKKIYNETETVFCPYLENQPVHFTKEGFNHLIRKSGRLRTSQDRNRRFRLLRFTKDILTEKSIFVEYRKEVTTNAVIEFWRFSKSFSDQTITLVVKRFNKGRFVFLSIMSKTKKSPSREIP